MADYGIINKERRVIVIGNSEQGECGYEKTADRTTQGDRQRGHHKGAQKSEVRRQ